MSKDKIILFDDKKNCCACGACMNVCPKDGSQVPLRFSKKNG